MPLYAYKCKNCEYEFDVRQRFSDEPLTICPRCEGEVRRVITPVGVVFKGSGFYVTDNRNGSGKAYLNGSSTKNEEKRSESSSTEKGSESTSKETTSETKTEKSS
jgi:putative FmdB family regulatory protein